MELILNFRVGTVGKQRVPGRASHKTFEDYCQERFGIVRTTANRGIAFAGVLENLMPRGIKSLPTTEYQARSLTALQTPELQAALKVGNPHF